MKLGPYDLNSIITGDARELSKAIPDASVDLIFTDPPYNVGFLYGSGKTDLEMDIFEPAALVAESLRIGAVVLITPGIINVWNYPRPNWLIGWFKPGSTGRSMILNGFNTWEPILVYNAPHSTREPRCYSLPCRDAARCGKSPNT